MSDLDGLRTELRVLAGEARPVDLTERVIATSRRVRRRRRSTAAAIGGTVLTLVLILGVVAVAFPGLRNDAVTPDHWPADPFPRVWNSGDRELMDVTLPDGTVARLSYPKSLSFKDYGLETRTRYVNRSSDLRGRGTTCCALYFDPDLRGRKIDTVTDRRGDPVELWQGRIIKGPEPQPHIPDNPAYLKYGRWYVELSLEPEQTLDAAAAERIVRRLDLRRSGGYLVFPAEVGTPSGPSGLIQPDPDDVISDPLLRFRAGGGAKVPARSISIDTDTRMGRSDRWASDLRGLSIRGLVSDGLSVQVIGKSGTDDGLWARRLGREIKIWRLR